MGCTEEFVIPNKLKKKEKAFVFIFFFRKKQVLNVAMIHPYSTVSLFAKRLELKAFEVFLLEYKERGCELLHNELYRRIHSSFQEYGDAGFLKQIHFADDMASFLFNCMVDPLGKTGNIAVVTLSPSKSCERFGFILSTIIKSCVAPYYVTGGRLYQRVPWDSRDLEALFKMNSFPLNFVYTLDFLDSRTLKCVLSMLTKQTRSIYITTNFCIITHSVHIAHVLQKLHSGKTFLISDT